MTGITVPDSAKLEHPGQLLLIGAGMVPQCLLPMLHAHLGMDFARLTIIDANPATEQRVDKRLIAAGARFVCQEITPDNAAKIVADYAGPGGTVVNLTTGIDSCFLAQVCADQPFLGDPRGVRLLDASCEVWPRFTPPQAGYGTGLMDHTLYARECRVRAAASSWREGTGTYLGGIGANPGLIEVWARQCLADQARYLLTHRPRPLLGSNQRTAVETALEAEDWARLARAMGVQALIDSERDDSAAAYPRVPGEDACTWSPEGWIEEAGWNTVQLGWGTAQMHRPGDALSFDYGPLADGRMIVLPRLAAETLAIGWTPHFQNIIGYVVPHMENVWLTDAMTVYDGDGAPVWNPSVWYTYCPPDLTRAATLEFEMRGWRVGTRQVALTDEHIRSGRDELGILSLGPPIGWYCGASTTEKHVRDLFADCDPATFNATTAQVAAGVLAGLYCLAEYPNEGYITPEFVADHYRKQTLALIGPYVGGLVSVPTDPSDWHPGLLKEQHPLAHLWPPTPGDGRYQWDAFLLR
jgi:homospermidine synthase